MEKINYALIGFACDEGVRRNNGRVGAASGPDAFREALTKIQVTHNDYGNIYCADQNLEDAQYQLGRQVTEILRNDETPIVIGGGHETAWGTFQGISNYLGDANNCGIINFDAHFDLRPLLDGCLGTSGTPFTQIAAERAQKNLTFDYLVLGIQPYGNADFLFEAAAKLNVAYVLAENLSQEASIQIEAFLAKHEQIYLSICLDVFAEAFAPGVSAPQALGLLPHAVLPLLKQIRDSGKVIAIDIVELAPPYDRQNTTAKLAATLAAYIAQPR
ncbi:MAG: formimidoylglutamase [Myxococcota bacterium]